MIRRESLHMITTFPSTSSGGGRKEIGREEEISAQSASRILELVESPRRHKSAFCRRKPDCKSLRMVHCSPLFLLLLLASTLTIHPTGCLCHAGPWGSSFQTTNASPTRSGIIRRFISSSCSNHEAQNGGVNPFVLGFQRALTQSSLPLAISTVPASSCSVADRHKNKNHGDEESPTPNASSSSSFARFASVQPKESSEIRATIQPLMMQLKRRKLTKRFTSNNRHSLEDVSEEEAFWLDQDDVDDYFDEETSMMTPLDAQKSMIPCSTKTHSAALHGKFIHEASNHQRRFIPFRSVTAASKAAVEEQSISDSSMINPTETRGGSSSTAIATNAAAVAAHRPLYFWENMLSGAVSRSVAQTIMHPANCMKTMLQNSNDMAFRDLCQPEMFRRLTVGAGANFVLSIPHGAVNFAVLEFVRGRLSTAVENIPYLDERKDAFGPALDFLSSCLSTITCSIVSTPQMMITDVRFPKCTDCFLDTAILYYHGRFSHTCPFECVSLFRTTEHYGRYVSQLDGGNFGPVSESRHHGILCWVVARIGGENSIVCVDMDFLSATQTYEEFHFRPTS